MYQDDPVLKALFDQIDQLTPFQFAKLKAYMEDHFLSLSRKPSRLSPEERVAMFDKALQEFREGMTQEELDELTNAMKGKPTPAATTE